MKSSIFALLVFASQISGYPLPKDANPIVTEEDFKHKNPCDSGYGIAKTDMLTGHIILNHSEWNSLLPIEQNCAMAHELTHYLQWADKIPFTKVQELEPPAYHVEAACFKLYNDTKFEKWANDEADKQQTCKK